ncbi:peptidase U62 modulator of DNA gyrase [Gemmatirosa kalamazoonensis]|uniref:Peptidase U62 modulator of DNA gyrase n=1 Tax=Gemmatirosa kalamazoonensis TaxID=861299 RepID=W0RE90_9BACT|nr:TldD/PmbA family protein [Gemmatirosa kalamazoonensis]AHG88742.1 peptidase U62 modulator of DNA gyrase [Gemmatirosa kalamazoonensis]
MSMRPYRLLAADPRDDAEALTKKVLGFATADETRVVLRHGWTGQTRFAAGEITTSGSGDDRTVTVVSTFGKRRASSTTNVLDDASLKRTVELAERLAKLSPEDPELMPELGPQQYRAIQAFDARTASLDAAARADAVAAAVNAARRSGPDLFVAGYLEANAMRASAIATSRGLFAFHQSTDVNLSNTVRTPDGTGSGWASGGGRGWADVDPAALGARAAQKAVASRNPVAIEPGRYTVILEPQAVGDLVPLLLGLFNARTAEEGRSPFSRRGAEPGATRLGEQIADPRVTLFSDPTDPELLGAPFDAEGLPLGRRVWIENGKLATLAYSRFWAQKRGLPESAAGGGGGGFGGGGGGGGGGGAGLKMLGGTKSLDEIIAGTDRAVLVTHNFYIRPLDARTASYTGITRDGTFLVENGKITRSIKNFRWNESPLLMLNRVLEIGRAERIGPGQVMPSLKVADFNFASISEAV